MHRRETRGAEAEEEVLRGEARAPRDWCAPRCRRPVGGPRRRESATDEVGADLNLILTESLGAAERPNLRQIGENRWALIPEEE